MFISMSQFQNSSLAEKNPNSNVDMRLNIASLVSTLTRNQKDILVKILVQVVNTTIACQGAPSGLGIHWHTKIPTCMKEVMNFYIRGKNAIPPNVSRPAVSIVGSHVYVSLIASVADILGHGPDLDFIANDAQPLQVHKLSECKIAKAIYQRSMENPSFLKMLLCLYITIWSDAFEPSSCTKSNRGSCWIKTITILPPQSELHKMTYTYSIAIGKDSDDHSEVEQRFVKELQNFKKGINVPFYYGKLKKKVYVYLELMVSLQDQPKRRKFNCIMLGGSKYSARCGHSMALAQLSQSISSCSTCCRNIVLDNAVNRCNKCLNWDIDNINNNLLKFPMPLNYPRMRCHQTIIYVQLN